jgi:hypothetical protein
MSVFKLQILHFGDAKVKVAASCTSSYRIYKLHKTNCVVERYVTNPDRVRQGVGHRK